MVDSNIPLDLKFNISFPDHVSVLHTSVTSFFLKEEYLDLIFICKQNVRVASHKMLFIVVSDFISNILLTSDEETVYVSLPDIDSVTMEILIRFLYEGFTRVNVNQLICLKELMNLLSLQITNSEVLPEPQRESEFSDENIIRSEIQSDTSGPSLPATRWKYSCTTTLSPAGLQKIQSLTPSQIQFLTKVFNTNKYPSDFIMKCVGNKMQVPWDTVLCWFIHRHQLEAGATTLEKDNPVERESRLGDLLPEQLAYMEEIFKVNKSLPSPGVLEYLENLVGIRKELAIQWFHQKCEKEASTTEVKETPAESSVKKEFSYEQKIYLEEFFTVNNDTPTPEVLEYLENRTGMNSELVLQWYQKNVGVLDIISSDTAENSKLTAPVNLSLEQLKILNGFFKVKSKPTENMLQYLEKQFGINRYLILQWFKKKCDENVSSEQESSSSPAESSNELPTLLSPNLDKILETFYKRYKYPSNDLLQYLMKKLSISRVLLVCWFDYRQRLEKEKLTKQASTSARSKVEVFPSSTITATDNGNVLVVKHTWNKRKHDILNEAYQINNDPGVEGLEMLASFLELPMKMVSSWFNCRRLKDFKNKKQTDIPMKTQDSSVQSSQGQLLYSEPLSAESFLTENMQDFNFSYFQTSENSEMQIPDFSAAQNDGSNQVLIQDSSDYVEPDFQSGRESGFQVLSGQSAVNFPETNESNSVSAENNNGTEIKMEVVGSDTDRHPGIYEELSQSSSSDFVTDGAIEPNSVREVDIESILHPDISNKKESEASQTGISAPITDKKQDRLKYDMSFKFSGLNNVILEEFYSVMKFPSPENYEDISYELDIPVKNVRVWFARRRNKDLVRYVTNSGKAVPIARETNRKWKGFKILTNELMKTIIDDVTERYNTQQEKMKKRANKKTEKNKAEAGKKNSDAPAKEGKKRFSLTGMTYNQIQVLEASYEVSSYGDYGIAEYVASYLGFTVGKVRHWLRKRRCKTKPSDQKPRRLGTEKDVSPEFIDTLKYIFRDLKMKSLRISGPSSQLDNESSLPSSASPLQNSTSIDSFENASLAQGNSDSNDKSLHFSVGETCTEVLEEEEDNAQYADTDNSTQYIVDSDSGSTEPCNIGATNHGINNAEKQKKKKKENKKGSVENPSKKIKVKGNGLTDEQVKMLEIAYGVSKYLMCGIGEYLSEELNIPKNKIKAWFAQRRSAEIKEHASRVSSGDAEGIPSLIYVPRTAAQFTENFLAAVKKAKENSGEDGQVGACGNSEADATDTIHNYVPMERGKEDDIVDIENDTEAVEDTAAESAMPQITGVFSCATAWDDIPASEEAKDDMPEVQAMQTVTDVEAQPYGDSARTLFEDSSILTIPEHANQTLTSGTDSLPVEVPYADGNVPISLSNIVTAIEENAVESYLQSIAERRSSNEVIEVIDSESDDQKICIEQDQLTGVRYNEEITVTGQPVASSEILLPESVEAINNSQSVGQEFSAAISNSEIYRSVAGENLQVDQATSKKVVFISASQNNLLNEVFKRCPRPSEEILELCSKRLQIHKNVLKCWFESRCQMKSSDAGSESVPNAAKTEDSNVAQSSESRVSYNREIMVTGQPVATSEILLPESVEAINSSQSVCQEYSAAILNSEIYINAGSESVPNADNTNKDSNVARSSESQAKARDAKLSILKPQKRLKIRGADGSLRTPEISSAATVSRNESVTILVQDSDDDGEGNDDCSQNKQSKVSNSSTLHIEVHVNAPRNDSVLSTPASTTEGGATTDSISATGSNTSTTTIPTESTQEAEKSRLENSIIDVLRNNYRKAGDSVQSVSTPRQLVSNPEAAHQQQILSRETIQNVVLCADASLEKDSSKSSDSQPQVGNESNLDNSGGVEAALNKRKKCRKQQFRERKGDFSFEEVNHGTMSPASSSTEQSENEISTSNTKADFIILDDSDNEDDGSHIEMKKRKVDENSLDAQKITLDWSDEESSSTPPSPHEKAPMKAQALERVTKFIEEQEKILKNHPDTPQTSLKEYWSSADLDVSIPSSKQVSAVVNPEESANGMCGNEKTNISGTSNTKADFIILDDSDNEDDGNHIEMKKRKVEENSLDAQKITLDWSDEESSSTPPSPHAKESPLHGQLGMQFSAASCPEPSPPILSGSFCVDPKSYVVISTPSSEATQNQDSSITILPNYTPQLGQQIETTPSLNSSSSKGTQNQDKNTPILPNYTPGLNIYQQIVNTHERSMIRQKRQERTLKIPSTRDAPRISKSRRGRPRKDVFTPGNIAELEKEFTECGTPSASKIVELALKMKVSVATISKWFSDKRNSADDPRIRKKRRGRPGRPRKSVFTTGNTVEVEKEFAECGTPSTSEQEELALKMARRTSTESVPAISKWFSDRIDSADLGDSIESETPVDDGNGNIDRTETGAGKEEISVTKEAHHLNATENTASSSTSSASSQSGGISTPAQGSSFCARIRVANFARIKERFENSPSTSSDAVKQVTSHEDKINALDDHCKSATADDVTMPNRSDVSFLSSVATAPSVTPENLLAEGLTYNCTICKKKFSEREQLGIHMTDVHFNNVSHESDSVAFDNAIRTYSRKKCNETAGEKFFVCTICEEQVEGVSNFIEHMRTHTSVET